MNNSNNSKPQQRQQPHKKRDRPKEAIPKYILTSTAATAAAGGATSAAINSSSSSSSSSCGGCDLVVRSVVPYMHEFRTFVKGRWLGCELLDVLSREFGSHAKDYWEEAIRVGNVRINNRLVAGTHVLRNGEALLHRTHRHEPPVTGNVVFVGELEDLIAVCKPASLPMHPCGAYRQNSLTSILQYEPVIPNQPMLRLVHRLDRVTSGLVVLAKTQEAASRVSEEIRSKTTRKVCWLRCK
jgi:tRNA pseudouridine synthase 9